MQTSLAKLPCRCEERKKAQKIPKAAPVCGTIVLHFLTSELSLQNTPITTVCPVGSTPCDGSRSVKKMEHVHSQDSVADAAEAPTGDAHSQFVHLSKRFSEPLVKPGVHGSVAKAKGENPTGALGAGGEKLTLVGMSPSQRGRVPQSSSKVPTSESTNPRGDLAANLNTTKSKESVNLVPTKKATQPIMIKQSKRDQVIKEQPNNKEAPAGSSAPNGKANWLQHTT